MLRVAVVLCLLAIISSSAFAQGGKYWGITLGSSEYEEVGYSADMPTATGRLGYEMEYSQLILGAETRLGYGYPGSFNNVDIQMNWLISALGKASWEAMERVFITGYAGFTMADTEATTSLGSSKITESSFSYGVSVDLYADNRHGLNFEWVRFLDGEMRGADYTVDYIGLGYFQRF